MTDLRYQTGFGNAFQSEAEPGTLPLDQNSPRHVAHGLLAEQINGTGFTLERHRNHRVWLYRLRAQILDRPFRPVAPGRFTGRTEDFVSSPEVMRWRPATTPGPGVDFLEGLTTVALAGDPTIRRGMGFHRWAATSSMERTVLCNIDGDLLIVPWDGSIRVRTELGWLAAAPGEIVLVPRGLRFQVHIDGPSARGFVAEVYDGHLELPQRGLIGANGLADERHFRAPVADYEDLSEPHRIVVKQAGRLWETLSPYSPFDVVAWHGSYAPFVYDLAQFASFGSVSWDHADPSVLTVLTCPADTHGRNAMDVGVFAGRWDVTEHTFRLPFFHRNSAVEINTVIKGPERGGWARGTSSITPYLTPHGVSATGYARHLEVPEEELDTPERLPDSSLWVQFESTYLPSVAPWALEGEGRDADFLSSFSGYPEGRVP